MYMYACYKCIACAFERHDHGGILVLVEIHPYMSTFAQSSTLEENLRNAEGFRLFFLKIWRASETKVVDHFLLHLYAMSDTNTKVLVLVVAEIMGSRNVGDIFIS